MIRRSLSRLGKPRRRRTCTITSASQRSPSRSTFSPCHVTALTSMSRSCLCGSIGSPGLRPSAPWGRRSRRSGKTAPGMSTDRVVPQASRASVRRVAVRRPPGGRFDRPHFGQVGDDDGEEGPGGLGEEFVHVAGERKPTSAVCSKISYNRLRLLRRESHGTTVEDSVRHGPFSASLELVQPHTAKDSNRVPPPRVESGGPSLAAIDVSFEAACHNPVGGTAERPEKCQAAQT